MTEVERIAQLEAILPTLATKADIGGLRSEMHEIKSDIIKWVVGTAIGIAVAAVTVGTFVLNNAVPKQASQPPIIINVPPAK